MAASFEDEKKSSDAKSIKSTTVMHDLVHKDEEAMSASQRALEIERKKVLRKMDIHILPFVPFLFLLFLFVLRPVR